MTISSGLGSQFGFAAEGTAGTFQTPTKFLEFTGESLALHRNRIPRRGMRAGRRTLYGWAATEQWVDGDVNIELGPQGSALLFKHALGSVVTTGANPYTHTCTPGSPDALALTVQVNRPDIGGVDRAFSYLGCSITGFELGCKVGEFLMGKFSFYGMHEDTAQALASASYPAGYAPFVFTQASLTIAAAAYDITEFTFAGDNGLKTGRHYMRATTPERPKLSKEADQRQYTGTLKSDFIDLTAYNRFVNGTEAALAMTFNAGASAQLIITANVRFDGDTPQVSGPSLLEQSLPFVCTSGTSDAAAVTIAVVNADTTP